MDGRELSNVVRHKFATLKSLLQDLKRDLPVYGPKRFAEALLVLAEGIRRSFEDDVADFASRNVPDARLRELSEAYLAHVKVLHEMSGYLQTVGNTQLPVELLLVLKQWSASFNGEVSLALLPEWEYLYEIKAYPVAQWRNSFPIDSEFLDQEASRLPDLFAFIRFPYLEGRNALLQVMIGHEMGHLHNIIAGVDAQILADINVPEARILEVAAGVAQARYRAPLDASPDAGATRAVSPEQREQIVQAVRTKARRLISSWVAELVADLFAIRTLGPAYLFAFEEMSTIAVVMNKYSATHPSSAFRLTFLLRELEHSAFIARASIPAVRERLLALKADLAGRDLTPSDEFDRIAYETLVQATERIHETVRDTPGAYQYGVEAFNRDVPTIVDQYLARGVPPIEHWDATGGFTIPWNLVSIINGAWVAYLTRMGDFYALTSAVDGDAKSVAQRNYSDIILKAIEASHIKQSWNP